MTAAIELARQQWADGHRRLTDEGALDPRRYREMLALVETLLDELRRRIGGVYTLEELAAAYGDSDSWARDTLAAAAPPRESSPDAALATDAAFYLYARGAQDYVP